MSLRFHALALAAFGITLLVRPINAADPAAKDTAKAPKNWTLPHTPDGQPDFQGYWTNATYIPLERPKELADKEFFTEAEAVAFEKKKMREDHSQAADDIHYDNVIWQGDKYAKGSPSLRTSIVFDPPDGRLPPLSPQGQKRAAELAVLARDRDASVSAESRTLGERCISWGADGPPLLGSTYNANFQILQNGSSVVILTEMIHAVRTIPLDGGPHLAASIRQLAGDSRGHWEGDTLVVDSTNFTDQTNFRGPPATARQDIFSSPELHVIERFTRINEDTIVYRFTVDDPGTWTRPWSGETLMRKTGGPIFEYACHEGNYGLVDILAGARAAEKKKAQDTHPTCNKCSGAYIGSDEIQAYLKRSPGDAVTDQQIRAVDIGKSNVDIGVVYRGKQTAGGAVAEHDLVSEVYHVIDGSATLVLGSDITDLKQRPADDRAVRLLNGPGGNGVSIRNGITYQLKPGDVVIIPAGVGHWFTKIDDHIAYLMVRVDPDKVTPLKDEAASKADLSGNSR